MQNSNTDKVRSFIAKWEAIDIDGIIDAFSETPVYHNMPMEPLSSKEAIRSFVEQIFVGVKEVKFDLCFIAEDQNGIVLTERIDHFVYPDKKISLPVMGTFEFEDGKIVKWREYFDMKDFAS